VIHTGQPLLLTPETMAGRMEELRFSFGINPFCWLGVPLKSHKGTIGALVLKSYPGGVCYNVQDQELLQFVSTQIATVIERQQMQARLQHMAQYDQLTDLPNRSLLYDRLKAALATACHEQSQLALLFIDLDKFKQVNDTLGHGMGDLLLQETAVRLKRCLRESDTVARIGGDEFVVLLQRPLLPEHAELVAKKIDDAFRLPFSLDGYAVTVAPSIGIACYPEHGSNEQQLLDYADKAMYVAKQGKTRRQNYG